MNLDAFESGVRALVRTGRHGRTAIEWEQPCAATLYLQKDRQGRCCVLALQDRDDFAEFDPRHHSEGEGFFQTEDYALEVLQIPLES